MNTIPFDPSGKLILIQTQIAGPLGVANCLFALDCAATITLVKPEVLDSLGYNPRDAERISTVTSVLGEELGYIRRIERLTALGFVHDDFQVNAHDLHEKAGIDGLLGLNFLREYNYEVRSKEGVIRIERADAQ